MSKFAVLLFPLLLAIYTPRTCRTQPLSGTPLITATKNVLAMTRMTVESANVNGTDTQAKIKEVMNNLRNNATVIRERIDTVVQDATTNAELNLSGHIDSLGLNISDVVVNDCGKRSSSVKSAAAKILMDANSCVSNTVESIERELNDTFSSIESILARINSDQNLSETCVAEYDKTEMALRNAVVTTLCVTQAKERIVSAIKEELSSRNDAAFLHVLYNDAMIQLTRCADNVEIASLVADTDDIITCIKMHSWLRPVTES